MAKLVHYRDNCIGCGICQERQPELWRMSTKDGKAVLLQARQKKDVFLLAVHAMHLSTAKETAAACPANVIKIV